MKTISVLREELAAYLAADIEHPTQSTLAKDDLANARYEYQHACVNVVESLIKCECDTSVLDIFHLELKA
jgi:hypothetical protein